MIDINVSYGVWPFEATRFSTPASLVRHLQDVGIDGALISHLGAVFASDPHPYNMQLSRSLRRHPGFHAIPVVNPALRGWRRDIDALPDKPVAVRLLPAYHNYTLRNRRLAEFAGYCAESEIPICLQLRMDDERTRYFGLRIPRLKTAEITAFVDKRTDGNVVVLNAYMPEVKEIAELAPTVSFDTSFAEWLYTTELLVESVGATRIMFGSHTPLLATTASMMKVFDAAIPSRTRNQIAQTNALRVFGLTRKTNGEEAGT